MYFTSLKLRKCLIFKAVILEKSIFLKLCDRNFSKTLNPEKLNGLRLWAVLRLISGSSAGTGSLLVRVLYLAPIYTSEASSSILFVDRSLIIDRSSTRKVIDLATPGYLLNKSIIKNQQNILTIISIIIIY